MLCGVCFLGCRTTPLAWLGILVEVPALWLLSGAGAQHGASTAQASADGLLASLGVAVQHIGLAQAGAGSGVRPVVAGRVAAVFPLLPSALRHIRRFRRPPNRRPRRS